MEKRVVLFLLLSLAIILGYDYLLKELGLAPPPPPSGQPESSKGSDAPSPSTPAASLSAPPLPYSQTSDQHRSGVSGETAVQSAVEEQRIEVITDLYRAVLANRGGTIRSWQLNRYTTGAPDKLQLIQLVHMEGKFPEPLSIQTPDPAVNKALAEGLYRVERGFSVLDAEHPTGRLTLTYQIPKSDVRVVKQLTFHHRSYVVDVLVTIEGVSSVFDVRLGTNFGIVEWGEGFIGLIGPASMVDEKIEKDTPDAEVERKGSVRWAALQDKYFLSVLIPAGASSVVVKKEGDKLVSTGVRFTGKTSASGTSMQLYAGPKEFDTLRALNVGLEDTIDFGWFIYGSWSIVKAVAKPLFYVLRFLSDYTHNYGISIILLTVGIKLLFVPLQYKSYKSMKDMQVVQPKVAALQAKHKDDRERLNRELMKLYRDHKVNPVGGCLPMLLQMPVFVALFNILYMTIDLRQAPFVLWITDLSAQDPYYVLPVIMGVSMVVQQKIMPTTMDPTQARVMLLLPAFMTLLFLTFPAGLVLYWLTNNVLTITQQIVTDRYIFKKPAFGTASDGVADAVPSDGDKSAVKRNKDKTAQKAEANSRVETRSD